MKINKSIAKLATGLLAGCISGVGFSVLTSLAAQAQVNPVSQLIQVVRYQALHYQRFGRFSTSTTAITNFIGQLGSHYLASNANRNQVVVNAIPRNSNGFSYSVGVFVNPQNNRQLLGVVCQANQAGRNLPPRPGIGNQNGQVFAGCRTGSRAIAGPFQI